MNQHEQGKHYWPSVASYNDITAVPLEIRVSICYSYTDESSEFLSPNGGEDVHVPL